MKYHFLLITFLGIVLLGCQSKIYLNIRNSTNTKIENLVIKDSQGEIYENIKSLGINKSISLSFIHDNEIQIWLTYDENISDKHCEVLVDGYIPAKAEKKYNIILSNNCSVTGVAH